jgi:TRAP-type C4-dicarboxylate transport system permease small subunit
VTPAASADARTPWRRAVDAVYDGAGALAGLFVLTILVLMIGQSVLREFGVATGAVNDVVAWCCAASAFLAMAHTFRHGDFVRVTLLLDKLAPQARRWVELGCLSVGVLAMGYLTWSVARFVHESWAFEEMASGQLSLPIWIPQLSFVIGAALLLVAMLDEWLRVLRGARPTYVELVEQRHAQGDFSSDV